MAKFKEKVGKAINESINPRLAMHGGGVELVSIDEKKKSVSVRFNGMCVGCSMADMTFSGLIESELKEQVPEIKEILLAN